MKARPLPPAQALRSTSLPWNKQERHPVLPPENKDKRARAKGYTTEAVAPVEEFILVEVLAEDAKLSKTKARLAITRGQVSVNGAIVRDPDTRLTSADVVRFFPPSKIHVQP